MVEDGRFPGLISATPEQFAEQVQILADRFDVIDAETALAALAGEAALPPRAVLLTFDDAVDDFRTHAWPILTEAGVPSVVFVPTGYVGNESQWFWWDAVHAAVTRCEERDTIATPVGDLPIRTGDERLAAFRRLRDHFKSIPWSEVDRSVVELCAACNVTPPTARVMSWEELREVERTGVALCPHTRSHAHLDQVDEDLARREVEDSITDLRRGARSMVPMFAYPSGRSSDLARMILAETEIEAAVTTERGTNVVATSDPLGLRRINVSRTTGLGAARIRMHPWTAPIARRLEASG